MKLIKIEPNRSRILANSDTPLMRFTKTGLISFNNAACEKFSLNGGSKISLFQDEEHPKDWYIQFNQSGGIPLRVNKKKGNYNFIGFNSTDIKFRFFKSIEAKKDRGSVRIATEASTVDGHYALLTKTFE